MVKRQANREKQEVVAEEKNHAEYRNMSFLLRGTSNDLIAHCHAMRDFYFLSDESILREA